MSIGKVIETYYMDGDADGRWQIDLSSWDCTAFKIKKNDLKLCDDIPELHTPGVYFLFGKDDKTEQQSVYVGIGEDVLKRIPQAHTFDNKDFYWTDAVILVSLKGTLDKAKIGYLENRFHTIVKETGRFNSINGNTPTQSMIPKKYQDVMEEFISNTKLIMPLIGYEVFKPLPSNNKEEVNKDVLYFKRKVGTAKGKIDGDNFVVMKGSFISPDLAKKYLSPGVRKAREKYKDLISNNILTEDISFSSPSTAATFVSGRNENGLTAWKDENNKTLKELSK